jgi:CDP-diglyceride synthetase
MSQGLPGGAGTPARAREPIHPLPPTPDTVKRRRAGELALRLLTAALLIPPIIYVIFQGGVWVLVTVIVITLFGVNEFYNLIEAKGAEPLRGVGTLAAVALPVVSYIGSDYAATVLMSFLLLGLMVAQLGKAQIAESLASISGTFFGVFYIGWLLSHAVSLRGFHDVVQGRWGPDAVVGMHPDAGAFYLLFTITAVIAGDVGAYFVGRKYGRRKLAPKVSPGKTVEGAFGAVLGGLVAGLVCKALFEAWRPRVLEPAGLACLRAARAGPRRRRDRRRPGRVPAQARCEGQGHRHAAARNRRDPGSHRLQSARDSRHVLSAARPHLPVRARPARRRRRGTVLSRSRSPRCTSSPSWPTCARRSASVTSAGSSACTATRRPRTSPTWASTRSSTAARRARGSARRRAASSSCTARWGWWPTCSPRRRWRAGRPQRDRPRALLDGRRRTLRQRAADPGALPPGRPGARAQRQHHERQRAARRAGAARARSSRPRSTPRSSCT